MGKIPFFFFSLSLSPLFFRKKGKERERDRWKERERESSGATLERCGSRQQLTINTTIHTLSLSLSFHSTSSISLRVPTFRSFSWVSVCLSTCFSHSPRLPHNQTIFHVFSSSRPLLFSSHLSWRYFQSWICNQTVFLVTNRRPKWLKTGASFPWRIVSCIGDHRSILVLDECKFIILSYF